jgi:hypothetical protein
VLRRIGRVAIVFALCGVIGLQWAALQSIAWTAMLIEYSKHSTVCYAIQRTFDGAHPCSLCHAVSKAKSSEKKSDLQSSFVRLDMICPGSVSIAQRSFAPVVFPELVFFCPNNRSSPLAPPPRLVDV